MGLFPGAIVGVKGRNAGAGWFGVKEIWSVSAISGWRDLCVLMTD